MHKAYKVCFKIRNHLLILIRVTFYPNPKCRLSI